LKNWAKLEREGPGIAKMQMATLQDTTVTTYFQTTYYEGPPRAVAVPATAVPVPNVGLSERPVLSAELQAQLERDGKPITLWVDPDTEITWHPDGLVEKSNESNEKGSFELFFPRPTLKMAVTYEPNRGSFFQFYSNGSVAAFLRDKFGGGEYYYATGDVPATGYGVSGGAS
jgi:hypothetical protein